MEYGVIEASIDRGSPITLFEFSYGPSIGDAYRYVASVRSQGLNIIAAGMQWQPFQIKHGEISHSGQLDRAELTVTMSMQAQVTSLYRVAPPSTPVRLRIWRGHADDGDYRLIWSGRVLSAEWSGAEVQFTCEPVATSLKRVGLRRFYQYGCPHVLYGSACKVSRAGNTARGKVSAVNSGLDLVFNLEESPIPMVANALIAGICRVKLLDGRWAIRTITWAEGGPTQFTLKLMSVLPDMQVGLEMEVSRGCEHNFHTCRDRFHNTVNFGGCPNIPMQNPFAGNSF